MERGIELRRPWGSRVSTLVCTYGHATKVPTEGAPATCPACDLVSADEAQAILDVCDMAATLPTSAEQVLPREGRTLLDTVPDLARTVVALRAQLDVLPALLRGAAGAREGLPHAATTDAEVEAAVAILRASGAKRFRLEWLDANDQPIRTATPEEDRAHLVIYQTALARAHQGLDALAERDGLRTQLDAVRHLLDSADVPPPGDSLARRLHEVIATHAGYAADLRDERNAQRAILEGRTTAPKDAEIEAHYVAGGAWLMAFGGGARPVFVVSHGVENTRWNRSRGDVIRWVAIDATGRPCAWPTVASEGGAP